eukprot:3190581-Amphidinium_carterae.1
MARGLFRIVLSEEQLQKTHARGYATTTYTIALEAYAFQLLVIELCKERLHPLFRSMEENRENTSDHQCHTEQKEKH